VKGRVFKDSRMVIGERGAVFVTRVEGCSEGLRRVEGLARGTLRGRRRKD
jgi:hypothetical protein